MTNAEKEAKRIEELKTWKPSAELLTFLKIGKGQTDLRVVNGFIDIPEGSYTGKLVIINNEPAREMRLLQDNQVLTFLVMDITDGDGENTYPKTSINFNTTMEAVVLNPELWDKPFQLEAQKRISGAGNPYMSVTITSNKPVGAEA